MVLKTYYKNGIIKNIIKNRMCYNFDYIIKNEEFDSDNILIDKKSYEVFWFIIFHTNPWLVQNHCVLGLIK